MLAASQLVQVNYALIILSLQVPLLLPEGSTLALASTVGSEET